MIANLSVTVRALSMRTFTSFSVDEILLPRYVNWSVAVSVILYGYTTWTLTKRLEKLQNVNYYKMLRVVLYQSWKWHLSKQNLYDH